MVQATQRRRGRSPCAAAHPKTSPQGLEAGAVRLRRYFCTLAHRGVLCYELSEVHRSTIDRLFDPARDPEAKVRDDDWLRAVPTWREDKGATTMRWLYAYETVGSRREWYRRLEAEGVL